MSDQIVQSVNGTNMSSGQTVQAHRSVWMGISSDAAGETHNHNASRNKRSGYATKDDDLTNGSEVSSRSAGGLRMIEPKIFENVDEIIKSRSKSMENERMCISAFKYGQDSDEMQALRPVFEHNLESAKADCTSVKGIIPRGCHSSGEGTSKNLPKWIKTHSIGEDSPLQETCVSSSSHIVPYRFYLEETKLDKGKVAISPSISRSNVVSKQLTNAKMRMLEHEQCHDHCQSADLVCERKLDCPSQSDNSMDACFRESITCDRYLSEFSRDWVPKMQKCAGIRMFPSQCITSEETETRKSCNDCYSLLKLQKCVHDVERKRIFTTMDDSEGSAQGCPRFSQTTQGLLITEEIDVSLSKKNDIFRSTRVISKMDGDISSDLHHISPFFGQGKPKMEIQPLGSSIDIDVKEKVRDLRASKVSIKNELSAETDTMEMESFREKKLHSGSYSTASTKVLNMKSNLAPWLGLASSLKVELQQPNIELPDINFPALPENMRPISSKKTRSLEMEKLLGHDEYHPNADPGIRWVKRLKLSSSNSSAQYTKTSNLAENPSHQKESKSFGRTLQSSIITSSEPTPTKHHDEESNPSDKSGDFFNKDKDNLPNKKAKGLLLSHAWVQRWLSNGSRIAQTKPETVVVCKPQSSKFALENLEKEMCPSIAAMALMGKALTCFQPCELQKRGSFTVWNTNAF